MCDTNSKAYHDAEQEAFAKIQAEDEVELNLRIVEANLAEFFNSEEDEDEGNPANAPAILWHDCCGGYSCYCDSSY